jgi:hypothetical protein
MTTNETYLNMHLDSTSEFAEESSGIDTAEPEITGIDSGIIPFADEVDYSFSDTGADTQTSETALSPEAISPDEMGVSAHDEFGMSVERVSAVDRALGLGAQEDTASSTRNRGGYSCPCCGEGAKRVMRVRVVDPRTRSRWIAMCAVCAASMLAKIPGTIVGGMVRPTRKLAARSQRNGSQLSRRGGLRRGQLTQNGEPHGFRRGGDPTDDSGKYRQAG